MSALVSTTTKLPHDLYISISPLPSPLVCLASAAAPTLREPILSADQDHVHVWLHSTAKLFTFCEVFALGSFLRSSTKVLSWETCTTCGSVCVLVWMLPPMVASTTHPRYTDAREGRQWVAHNTIHSATNVHNQTDRHHCL